MIAIDSKLIPTDTGGKLPNARSLPRIFPTSTEHRFLGDRRCGPMCLWIGLNNPRFSEVLLAAESGQFFPHHPREFNSVAFRSCIRLFRKVSARKSIFESRKSRCSDLRVSVVQNAFFFAISVISIFHTMVSRDRPKTQKNEKSFKPQELTYRNPFSITCYPSEVIVPLETLYVLFKAKIWQKNVMVQNAFFLRWTHISIYSGLSISFPPLILKLASPASK